MPVPRRLAAVPVILLAWLAPASAQQPPPVATPPSPEQMEAFLLGGEILRTRPAGSGVTDSLRATLTDGTLTHDAHIQDVDISRDVFNAGAKSEIGFRDSFLYNIAAYRLAQLLGISQVPMSVPRRVGTKEASVTWWVDDVRMSEEDRVKRGELGPDRERFFKQLYMMYVFDELIQNRDRNAGNILWTSDFTMWLIDHTRAFRTGHDLERPERLLRIERGLFAALRALTREALEAATGRWLTGREREAVLARRDRLVTHFEERIETLGEAAVLYAPW